MEMILLDENGDRIQATVRKTLIYKFEKILMEGSVYSISGFSFASNGGSYRATRHPYKLSFQYWTKVVLMDEGFVTVSPFAFVPIPEIGDDYNTDYLVDVIGLFTAFGTEKEYVRNGIPTKMNVIELESNGYKMECALFGSYVDELNTFLGSGDVVHPVVIVQLAKVKSFKGKISLQNAIICTKIIFNPTCAEAIEFRQNMIGIIDSPSQTLSRLQGSSRVSAEEDFLSMIPRKNIMELNDTKEDICCVVMGTIKHVLEGEEWWYTACSCNKAVYADSKMYFCEKCNKHVMHVFPRYRIKVRVIDETDSATFVLFDRDATSAINKSCADLIKSFDKAADPFFIPKEISDLVEKTFLFKVEVKNSFNSRFDHSYRVRKICLDPMIVEKFKLLSSTLEADEGVETSLNVAISDDIIGQDLMSKFTDVLDESQAECGGAINLDLTQSPVYKTPAKRSSELEGPASEKASAKIMKKEIKIEKD